MFGRSTADQTGEGDVSSMIADEVVLKDRKGDCLTGRVMMSTEAVGRK
jgi:hypothetical protein